MLDRNRQAPALVLGKLATLFVIMVSLGACAPPLLSPNEPRSQFDRYDAVRNRRAEQDIFDDYGKKRPNLKERLTPRE